MSKLVILRGPSASGKSTYTTEALKNDENAVRVSRDLIRDSLFNNRDYQLDKKLSYEREKLVTQIEHSSIKEALRAGKTVYSDCTNIQNRFVKELQKIALYANAEVEIIEFIADKEELLSRNSSRENSVPDSVITRQLKDFSKESNKITPLDGFEEFKYVDGLQEVYVCDIDGTLAQLGDRDVYDGSKAHLDTVIEPVAEVVKALNKSIAPVIFVSGRSAEHREVTHKWLEDNGFEVHGLYMRGVGDFRKDDIVKYEIIKQFEGKVNVKAVIDDRPQVIRMWQHIGIPTFNVGKIDVEF